MVLDLCKTFGCLPSQLYEEDADLFRLRRIVAAGTPADAEGGEQ